MLNNVQCVEGRLFVLPTCFPFLEEFGALACLLISLANCMALIFDSGVF